jgi:DNA adenine methylase
MTRQPFSYYGGKQKLAKRIVGMLPTHKTYTESFFGGGSIFWGKEPSGLEVINDMNRELITFYTQLKTNFDELNELIQATPHSRSAHQDAWVMYNSPHLFSEVKRAWAIWVLTNQGFSSQISASFGVSVRDQQMSKKVDNKRALFAEALSSRLSRVTIECRDAVKVINQYDHSEALHYCDPPYYNSDCGHYDGYTKNDFERLLDTLAKVKGKFILSSYPSDVLDGYIKKHKWRQERVESVVTAAKVRTKPKIKTECITYNF